MGGAALASAAIWDLPAAQRAVQLDAKSYFYGSGPVNAAEQYKNTQLYQINPLTGLNTKIGEPYANGYDGLAYDPKRKVLYAFETSASGLYNLLVINPSTGAIIKRADLRETWKLAGVTSLNGTFSNAYIAIGSYNPETQKYVVATTSSATGAISINLSKIDVNPSTGEGNYGLITAQDIVEGARNVDGGYQYDWAVNPVDGRTYYLHKGYVYVQGASPVDGDWWQVSANQVVNDGPGYNKGIFFDSDGFMYVVNSPQWQSSSSRVFKIDLSKMTPPAAGVSERDDLKALSDNKRTFTGEQVANIAAPITDAAGYVVSNDFGDAPESYGTTLAGNGPRSLIDQNAVALGTEITGEADARRPIVNGAEDAPYDARGDQDDALSGDQSVPEKAKTFSIKPTVTIGTAQNVTVAAWLDVNGDGKFDDSERKVVSLSGKTGAQTPEFSWDLGGGIVKSSSAPAGTDETYLRLRVYDASQTNPSPLGNYAGQGEVEDYPVSIVREPVSNVNASASASADSRANAAAVAAAKADASSQASAAASANAEAAAKAAADADASKDASADAGGSAQAAAVGSADSKAASASNAQGSAAANGDASAAAKSAATVDASADASGDSDSKGADSSSDSKGANSSSDSKGANVNASASASADSKSNAKGANSTSTATADSTASASSTASSDSNANGNSSGIKVAIDKSTVIKGASTELTVTGQGFKPGEKVAGVLRSNPIDLGVKVADGQGQVLFSFNSGDLELGDHSVTLTATADSNRTGAVGFKVIPVSESSAAVDGNGQGLAHTGASGTLPLVVGGAALALLGAALWLFGARRRKGQGS
ncbi:GEVED domain-containing protein [Psychromicrobium sp. YIM B11713]|uniref:GEVED domain-containing protein n=1 Tax=Psychromicrobium sp. YIM B11713 TaxID=3145233 RepID=UPI00374F57CC